MGSLERSTLRPKKTLFVNDLEKPVKLEFSSIQVYFQHSQWLWETELFLTREIFCQISYFFEAANELIKFIQCLTSYFSVITADTLANKSPQKLHTQICTKNPRKMGADKNKVCSNVTKSSYDVTLNQEISSTQKGHGLFGKEYYIFLTLQTFNTCKALGRSVLYEFEFILNRSAPY